MRSWRAGIPSVKSRSTGLMAAGKRPLNLASGKLVTFERAVRVEGWEETYSSMLRA